MKLKNTSASQVETWAACPRAWHFNQVRGFKVPPTASMQRGTHIHSGAEHAIIKAKKLSPGGIDADMRESLLPGNDYDPYVRSMLPYLPLGQERVLVEKKFSMPTAPGLPPWFGVIDLIDDSRTATPYLRITDHKTTSDFRYNKTPEELKKNTQVASYAHYAYEEGHDEELIQVGHLYVKTSTKTVRVPKVLPVYTEVDEKQVDEIWSRDLISVEEMVRAAEIDNTDKLEPRGTSNGHCKKYGGCPHRSRCGISTEASDFRKTPATGTATMSVDFLARLKASKAAAGTNGVTAAATVAAATTKAKVPTGVLPPDAPPRTTPVKAKAPPAAPVEPQDDESVPVGASEVAAAAQVAKKPVGRPRKVVNGSTADTGFALYIDCMPTKNVRDEVGVTLFEDWVGQVQLDLAEYAQGKGLASWWMLPFAEQKMTLSAALDAKVTGGSMPSALVIMSGAPSAKDALDVLIPHAKLVVRGLRG